METLSISLDLCLLNHLRDGEKLLSSEALELRWEKERDGELRWEEEGESRDLRGVELREGDARRRGRVEVGGEGGGDGRRRGS